MNRRRDLQRSFVLSLPTLHSAQTRRQAQGLELDDTELNMCNLFVRRQCDNYVTRTEKLFNSHQPTHVQCKCATYHDTITKKLYEDVNHVQRNHWDEDERLA